MFLVLKLLVFCIWCCDGMRLGVQVMSACLVDVSVASRVAIATRLPTDTDRCFRLWIWAVGKWLFLAICRMVCHSCSRRFLFSGKLCILLVRNL